MTDQKETTDASDQPAGEDPPADPEQSAGADQSAGTDPSAGAEQPEQGPGWMPAILAATALMGMVGFVSCGFLTWILFQKRTEFAIRTLRGSYIVELEQSLLEPATKLAVVSEIKSLATDMERGKYDNDQAGGIMQRLQRLPVIQWGELQAIEESLMDDPDAASKLQQLSRLKRAVEMGTVTAIDFEDVLNRARTEDASSRTGYRLSVPLTDAQLDEVVQRARLVADRAGIPDETFDNVRIESIVRREIELGASEGG